MSFGFLDNVTILDYLEMLRICANTEDLQYRNRFQAEYSATIYSLYMSNIKQTLSTQHFPFIPPIRQT